MNSASLNTRTASIILSLIFIQSPTALAAISADLNGAFVTSVTDGCRNLQGATSKEYQAWFNGVLKDAGVETPKTETAKVDLWQSRLLEFKADKDDLKGQIAENSPGTFGEISKSPVKNANDSSGKRIIAPLVDIAKGTIQDFTKAGNVENKILLVERSRLVPETLALAMEAKNHKALALITYEKKNLLDFLRKPLRNDVKGEGNYPLPVLVVTHEVAQDLQARLKHQAVQMTLMAETLYPVSLEQQRIIIKRGDRNPFVLVTSNFEECSSLGTLMGLVQWSKENESTVKGTLFVIVNKRAKLPSESEWGEVVEFPGSTLANSDTKKILNEFRTLDQSPERLVDFKSISKTAASLPAKLKGLVESEEIKKYSEKLLAIEKIRPVNPLLLLKIKHAYEPILSETDGLDSLTRLTSDLRILQDMHAYAQKGMWEKAEALSHGLSGFDWAQNVSAETFAGYQKLAPSDDHVDAAVWLQVQKGRKGLDSLLEILESEIDRIENRITENFSRLGKALDGIAAPQKSAKL